MKKPPIAFERAATSIISGSKLGSSFRRGTVMKKGFFQLIYWANDSYGKIKADCIQKLIKCCRQTPTILKLMKKRCTKLKIDS